MEGIFKHFPEVNLTDNTQMNFQSGTEESHFGDARNGQYQGINLDEFINTFKNVIERDQKLLEKQYRSPPTARTQSSSRSQSMNNEEVRQLLHEKIELLNWLERLKNEQQKMEPRGSRNFSSELPLSSSRNRQGGGGGGDTIKKSS